MAATPTYAATPRIGAAKLNAAFTNLDGTLNASDLIVGAASGTRIDRVTVHLAGTGAASGAQRVSLWIWNGTTNYYYKDVLIPASAGNTNILTGPGADIATPNLVLPSASYTLRAGGATGGTATDVVHVIAFGADL